MKRSTYKKFIRRAMPVLLINLAAVSFHVYAESGVGYSVTVEPALNIATSSNKVSLDLNPLNHDFDSQDLTVSVSTNNETGYKLYVNADSAKLVEKDDSNLYIDTLSNETPENDFTSNRWGYRIGSGNYLPFESGILLNSSKVAAENNSSTLTFAAKVGYETKAGTYALALNFQATANPQIYEMQNLDSNLCTEDPMMVIDNRDGQEYVIQRLKDNNCWMMANLNLGAMDLQVDQLDASNTNFTGSIISKTITKETWSSYKKDVGGGGPGDLNYLEYIPITDNNSATGSDTDPISNNKYGTLYTYCLASAGTICSSTNTNATSDLCPAGWRMPTGGPSGEFKNLYDQPSYNSYDKMRASVANNGAAISLSGVFSSAVSLAPTLQGTAVNIYTSTSKSNGESYVLSANPTNGVIPFSDAYSGRGGGRSVRCILK